MSVVLKALIRAYRVALSPAFSLLGAQCRFYPSCSQYAHEALDRLPLHTALVVIAKRLLRCGPWSEGGLDPVPKPGVNA